MKWNGAGYGGRPYNHALHPAAGRGALLLKARRCSAPAAGERGRWNDFHEGKDFSGLWPF